MNDERSAHFSERIVGAYLDALSAGTATPGGGSAAALAGALGCSLGAMVCELTRLRHPSNELDALTSEFRALADKLLTCGERDEQVFAAYRSAVAKPKSNDEEKAARSLAIEKSLVTAAQVPLETIQLGKQAFDGLLRCAEIGTPHALGDLATAGYLLQAMMLSCLENVEANARLMKSHENAQFFETAALAAHVDIDASLSALTTAIEARLTARPSN